MSSAQEQTGQPAFRAVLNSADSVPPPSAGNGAPGAVTEHALSGLLDPADSLSLPQKPADPASMVSERFLSLDNDSGAEVEASKKQQSSFEYHASVDIPAGNHSVEIEVEPEPEPEPARAAPGRSWHPSTPVRGADASPPPPPPQDLAAAGRAQAPGRDRQEGHNQRHRHHHHHHHSQNQNQNQNQNQEEFKVQAPPPPPQAQAPRPPAPPKAPPARVEGSAEVWRADVEASERAARERDVAAASAGLPRVRPRWSHNYLKLLLVGDDGLGKTTFVRNLFAAYATDVDFPVADASVPGAAAAFGSSPERLCTEMVVKDEEAQTWWHYLVQDTPGYGDFDGPDDAEAQRDAILSHVRDCSSRYFDEEAHTGRRVPASGLEDCRVDVCLYFVAPHRARRSDLRFMRQLAGMVPVVPVLAKADSMTAEELEAHRSAVRSALARSGAIWRFSDAALEEAGVREGAPFAVIGSASVDRAVGRFWPVRRYPWGRCEPLLTAHSQLPALRRLLFEAGYWELKARTESRYLRFRETESAERNNPVPRPLRGLVRLAGSVALVVAASYAAVNLAPVLRDRVVRRETVRRVKAKVNEAVEGAVEAVYDAKDRALAATDTARSSAAAAVDTTRQRAVRLRDRAVDALEADEVRAAREEAARVRERRRLAEEVPWWQFWRHGGGLE